MRPGHVLVVLLLLAVLGAHAYVKLAYDYAGAPRSVKAAIGLGFLAVFLLVILIAPRLRRSPVILPV